MVKEMGDPTEVVSNISFRIEASGTEYISMCIPLMMMTHIRMGMRFIASQEGSPPNLFLIPLSGRLSKCSVHRIVVIVQDIATKCIASSIRAHSEGGEKSSSETIDRTTIWIANSIIHRELRSPDLASLYSSHKPRIEDHEGAFPDFSSDGGFVVP